MSGTMKLPDDSPIMIAWREHQASEEYANAKRWAAHEQHVDGSLWVTFLQGWTRAEGRMHALRSDPGETEADLQWRESGMWQEWLAGYERVSDDERARDPRYMSVERWTYRLLSTGHCPGSLPVAHAIIEDLDALAAPSHDVEPSAPTRTSEQGLSYHDGTEALREALEETLGGKDFSPGLDALAGTVRYREIEEGRWDDLNRLYVRLVDLLALSQHVGGEG